MVLSPVPGVLFRSFLSWNLRFMSCQSFLSFLFCFKSSAALARTVFVFLALGFLGQEKSLAVVP